MRRADTLLVLLVGSVAAVASLALVSEPPVASVSDAMSLFGIVAGLIATQLALWMVVLAARTPWIDRAIGIDVAMRWHARLGKPVLYLLLVHGGALILAEAYSGNQSISDAIASLLTMNDMPLAFVSLGIFLLVVATSIALVRMRVPREAWWLAHLLSYVAIATAVPHQFTVGGIFVAGTPQWWFWLAQYAVVAVLLLTWRVVVPLTRSVQQQLVVTRVVGVGGRASSIELRGRTVSQLRIEPGQFLRLRFLTGRLWWQSHPYSISAVTDTAVWVTVSDAGAGSAATQRVPVGTKVGFSGPHGGFTPSSKSAVNTLLIGAGVGAAPLLAMAAALPGHTTGVLVRASDPHTAVLLPQMRETVAARGAWLRVLDGPSALGWAGSHGDVLDRLDLRDTDVYICGPNRWMAQVQHALQGRIPQHRIHREQFEEVLA